MFTQTIAIFVDAYRELNARKLFWIVLILSGVVVIAFAGIGLDANGLYIFGARITGMYNTAYLSKADLYKWLFQVVGINFWLTWAATILAIISTAGIFPDLLSNGALELYLSKPIGRLRLFFLKYMSGLLFVTLQVLVFCAACFLVIGIRGNDWEPGLFIAVPLMVCFFSYLFCVCVLLGILTRSTMAAALLTLLFWLCLFVVSASDELLLTQKFDAQQKHAFAARQLTEKEAASPLENSKEQLDLWKQEEQSDAHSLAFWQIMERGSYIVISTMPKTGATMDLVTRALDREANLKPPPSDSYDASTGGMFGNGVDTNKSIEQMKGVLRHRSASWVLGTSLLFEAAVLSLAAWIFCRRDG